MRYFILVIVILAFAGFTYINSHRTTTQQPVVQETEVSAQPQSGNNEPERDPAPVIKAGTPSLGDITRSILSAILPLNVAPTVTLEESGSMLTSTSLTWWLNSGGYMYTNGAISETIQGNLSTTNKWYLAYKKADPIDTDGGLHPQNIFRLVNRRLWQNYQQQVYFKITRQNLSTSDQRDEWSGLLLFNRYVDGDNLYYTGIRVDGTAVIKSKKKGIYTTLTQVPIFVQSKYNRSSNPTLLPQNTWIGLRSEVKNMIDGSVSIKLYMDNGMTGKWVLLTSYIDKTNPILGLHYNGIRTDFMDVQFQGYQVKGI